MVSIIVPVYNVREFLEESLESIAAQTYAGFECIIVDDGSTDGSGEMCDSFCAKDSRFRVIHQLNAGVGHARNAGLDEAKGEYILFVDPDDIILPTALEVAVNLISSGPYDWAMFDHTKVGLDGKPLEEEVFTDEEITFDGVYVANNICGKPSRTNMAFCVLWNKLYSREVLEGLRFLDIYTCEDMSFNLVVAQKTRKAIYKKSMQYFYRMRPLSLSNHGFGTYRALGRLMMMNMTEPLIILPQFRSIFLARLYRTFLSSRFDLERRSDLKDYYRIFKPLKKKTFSEYLHCKEISLVEKARIVFLLSFPRLGRILFRMKYR